MTPRSRMQAIGSLVAFIAVLPAIVFVSAALVTSVQPTVHEPSRTARQLVDWMGAQPTPILAILLLLGPSLALVIGIAVLWRRLRADEALRSDLRHTRLRAPPHRPPADRRRRDRRRLRVHRHPRPRDQPGGRGLTRRPHRAVGGPGGPGMRCLPRHQSPRDSSGSAAYSRERQAGAGCLRSAAEQQTTCCFRARRARYRRRMRDSADMRSESAVRSADRLWFGREAQTIFRSPPGGARRPLKDLARHRESCDAAEGIAIPASSGAPVRLVHAIREPPPAAAQHETKPGPAGARTSTIARLAGARTEGNRSER